VINFNLDKVKYIISKLKRLKQFVYGLIFSAILLTLFFYLILVPRYNANLNKLKQTATSTQKNNETPASLECPKCVGQNYDLENVKETYAVKITDHAWTTFSSNKVGIIFDYPIDGNKLVLFEYNDWPENSSDPSGIEFSWSISDIGAKYGHLDFAWGASRNLKIGREGVDIYNWTIKNGDYYIHSTIGESYKVEAVLTRQITNGGSALVYKDLCYYDYACSESELSSTLIVNLPQVHKNKVESVLFDIPKSFSNSDIDRLISSIKLLK